MWKRIIEVFGPYCSFSHLLLYLSFCFFVLSFFIQSFIMFLFTLVFLVAFLFSVPSIF